MTVSLNELPKLHDLTVFFGKHSHISENISKMIFITRNEIKSAFFVLKYILYKFNNLINFHVFCK